MRSPLSLAFLATNALLLPAQESATFRPPAIPLVTHDPYFSAWMRADALHAAFPTHWSGPTQALTGLVRIDGKCWRFLGREPANVPALPQTALTVDALTTQARFRLGDVELVASFTSPVLADDPEVASRAVTYLTVTVRSAAASVRTLELYVDASAEWAVHSPDQKVRWSRLRAADHDLLGFASQDQRVLERVGDHTRIDWGTFWLGAPRSVLAASCLGAHDAVRREFAERGTLPSDDDLEQPRAAHERWPVAAFAAAGQGGELSLPLVIAFDEIACVEYLGQRLRPYWARDGKGFGAMLAAATRERAALEERCTASSAQLRTELAKVGGARYADLGALVYRQTMAAQVLTTDAQGRLLAFTKENTSNGCIGTVDVLFPTAPFFLATNPELLAAHLRPILEYARSPRWRFPFAPHDLGTYPKANGQVYGGGEVGVENQMPVEECGNLLILVAAHALATGSLDLAREHRPALAKWCEYLVANGLDPAHQLCTDDFAGHLARNANLAIKAIVAIGGYSQLCAKLGDASAAQAARTKAEEYAKRWLELARGEEGTVLAYGQPKTWSLKYNLFWDRALGTALFPAALAESELELYVKKRNRYGTPMDSRADYTKPEWIVWCASLATSQERFRELVDPIWAFAHETKDRVPLSDWYMTSTGAHRGMHARSVIGGIYAPWYLARQGR